MLLKIIHYPLNYNNKGNYAIVSTFLPEIEIWDLDVLNVIEPTMILGGEIENPDKKKIKKFNNKK